MEKLWLIMVVISALVFGFCCGVLWEKWKAYKKDKE